MNLLQAIILGIIQGITEFLPVSSSGHLALAQNYFGEINVGFDVILHMATLLAVLVFFFKDIIKLIKGFFSFSWKNEDFRNCIYLIIATIPAGIVGWFFRNYIYEFFSNIYVLAIGFFITGMFLFTASFAKPTKDTNIKNTFVVGIAQALALVPGISRSGATVSTATILGIKRQKAIRFSFLLSIPAILAAVLVNFTDIKVFETNFIFGFLSAFIFGILAIFIFMRYLTIKRFRYFAYYCWLLAIICLISAII